MWGERSQEPRRVRRDIDGKVESEPGEGVALRRAGAGSQTCRLQAGVMGGHLSPATLQRAVSTREENLGTSRLERG